MVEGLPASRRETSVQLHDEGPISARERGSGSFWSGRWRYTSAPSAPITVNAHRGLSKWAHDGDGGAVEQHVANLTARASASVFAETYTMAVGSSLKTVRELHSELGKTSTTAAFPTTGLGKQLKMVSTRWKAPGFSH